MQTLTITCSKSPVFQSLFLELLIRASPHRITSVIKANAQLNIPAFEPLSNNFSHDGFILLPPSGLITHDLTEPLRHPFCLFTILVVLYSLYKV